MKEVTQRYVAVAICDLIQGSGKKGEAKQLIHYESKAT
jgi:hypothetical protein